MSGPEKHSLTLHGHRTSVTLEPEFWRAFRDIAEAEKQAINQLATLIDAERGEANLASAIRVYVLRHLQARITPETPEQHPPEPPQQR